jgi:hypothetical protein
VERGHVQYLGVTNAFRLAQADFSDRLVRALATRLRTIHEAALGDVELWSKTAAAQLDAQLRERRRNFGRRIEAIDRIQQATGGLNDRIAEIEGQESTLNELESKLDELTDYLIRVREVRRARAGGSFGCGGRLSPLAPLAGAFPRRGRRLAGTQRAPRPALAEHPRSLSGLVVRGDAAADPGGHGPGVFRTVSGAAAHGGSAGRRLPGRGARPVERAGVLQPCAQPAPMCAGRRGAARRRVSVLVPGASDTARHRALHRGGDRVAVLRRAGCDSGCQCQARVGARAGFRGRPRFCRSTNASSGTAPRNCCPAPTPSHGHAAVHAGHDGPRRHGMPAARTCVWQLPGRVVLQWRCAWVHRSDSR